MKNKHPIFYDHEKKRSKVISWIFGIVLFLLLAGIIGIGMLVAKDPLLPDVIHTLSLAPNHHKSGKTFTGRLHTFDQSAHKKQLLSLIDKELTAITPKTSSSYIIGFFVNWEDTSFVALKDHGSELTHLVPEWLHIQNNKNDLTLTRDNQDKESEVRAYVKSHLQNLSVFPLINNFNGTTNNWDAAVLHKLVTDSTQRKQFISDTLAYLQETNDPGIFIDFENWDSGDVVNFPVFLSELQQKLHDAGKQVFVAVPVMDSDFPLESVTDKSDAVVLMDYDEHWASSDAGPIASQKWFEDELAKGMDHIPSEKLILGLANYGYDWNTKNHVATAVSFQETMELADQYGGDLRFDGESLNPVLTYTDNQNIDHTVWFQDAATAWNQMNEARMGGLKGIALWKLGNEDPGFWNIVPYLSEPPQANPKPEDLSDVIPGYQVEYTGSGEILQVARDQTIGSRKVEIDSDGLVSDEEFVDLPVPYLITRQGGEENKKLVLTFDDGPDPAYTKQVLNVLNTFHVPATFFFIGSNEEAYPDIVSETIEKGNEIGNHTFFHPNIAHTSLERLQLELNATGRLFEILTRRKTILFRPPYAEDIEPESPRDMAPLLEATKMGYLTVGMHIDPYDWTTISSDEIVRRVVTRAQAGNAHIILLHDSGGNRDETIKALPKIIETLQKQGYTFTTIADLLHKKETDIMPNIPDPVIVGGFEGVIRILLIISNRILNTVFFIALCLGIIKVFLLWILSVIHVCKQRFRKPNKTHKYNLHDVCIIIPAYNEGKVIAHTLKSLQQYADLGVQILVVDDGSTDDTYQTSLSSTASLKYAEVLKKENGGKASAITFGLEHTTRSIIVLVDADTMIIKNAIELLLESFDNEKIGAVAGNIKVGNPKSWISIWQSLEYVTSQHLERRAFSLLNGISVVPGALGAWRRDLLLASGGFHGVSLAEDADATLQIVSQGYRVAYEPRALGYTEVPDTLKQFMRQRFRWIFGTLQVTWKWLWEKKNAMSLRFVILPQLVLFQFLFPLIAFFADIYFLFFLLLHLATTETGVFVMQSRPIILFYLFFFALDLVGALFAFIIEKRESRWQLLWLPVQRIGYRLLLGFILIRSCFAAVRGTGVGWNKLERQGKVHEHMK